MSHPYRSKDEVFTEGGPENVLVYRTTDRERHVAPARAATQIGVVGATAGVVASAAGFPVVGAAVLAGAMVVALWRWRRAPTASGLLFRVDSGELVVIDQGSKRLVVRTRLADLRNVSLDTRSIRKVEPGRDVVPVVQFIETQVGPEIDVARIVLERAGHPPLRLTDAFLSHTDSVEWIARIRVFLRSHGWLPEDERPS